MLEALPPAQRHAALIAQITEQASRALGGTHDAAPDPDASLLELGLDSLMAVELRNALASAAGRRLPATLLFDYPSTARLAAYFAEDIFGWARPAERPGVRPAAPEPAIPSSPEGMSDEMAVATIAAELEKWSARYG
jgi:acyl carrier protein